MTSRRSFFGRLAAFVAAPFVAKVLPETTAPVGELSLLTNKIVTFESLALFLNDLQIPRNINTDYNDQFGWEGAKAGDTIQIRIPYRFLRPCSERLTTEQRIFDPSRLPS